MAPPGLAPPSLAPPGLALAAISDTAPTGENLELTAAFGELERAAQGKVEQQYGETIIGAEAPDYKAVEAQALALLETTHDLRVLAHLAVARLHLHGLPAFAGVLSATRQVLHAHWDAVHPQLDSEDDHDPTLRANALLRLADPTRVLRPLRDMPLAVSPRAGRISWRDVAAASGAIEPPPGREKLAESVLRGAFADTDPARLNSLRAAAASAEADATALPAVFDAHCGFGMGPDLTELGKLLRDIGRAIDKFRPAGGQDAAGDPAEAPVPSMSEAEPQAGEPPADLAAGVPAAPRPRALDASALTAVNTRAEALHLIDLACEYYDRNEPSSPLPLLLRRARRLADMGFIEILRELAPEGVGQAQSVAGVRDA